MFFRIMFPKRGIIIINRNKSTIIIVMRHAFIFSFIKFGCFRPYISFDDIMMADGQFDPRMM